MTDHAHELRRYARKIAHPAGDAPAVMLAAADEIDRLDGVIADLRVDFEMANARMMTSAAAEREACANVCESGWKSGVGAKYQGDVFAAAIRARGDA